MIINDNRMPFSKISRKFQLNSTAPQVPGEGGTGGSAAGEGARAAGAAEAEAGAAQQEPDVERGQPGVPARLWRQGHAGVGQELPDRVQGQHGEEREHCGNSKTSLGTIHWFTKSSRHLTYSSMNSTLQQKARIKIKSCYFVIFCVFVYSS